MAELQKYSPQKAEDKLQLSSGRKLKGMAKTNGDNDTLVGVV